MSFAGIVACQVGTAFASRVEHTSTSAIGWTSNPLLLWGIAFELAFAAALIYLPPLQSVFGTRALGVGDLAILATFPVIVWGVDELRRWHARDASQRKLRTATVRADKQEVSSCRFTTLLPTPVDGSAIRPQLAPPGAAVEVPRLRLPAAELPADAAYQLVHDELLLDGQSRLESRHVREHVDGAAGQDADG